MAGRQGIKEKVHLPIYDSLRVEPKKQLCDIETASILRFFVNVGNKSKLETNASLRPHFSRFEARGMRVMISDLPAEFPPERAAANAEVEERLRPLREQIVPGNGAAGSLISKIIYNTVTSLFVGEKVIIQMPTWFFAGAGPFSETASMATRDEFTPATTFRFTEPIIIERQQNFRVEIEVPHADALKDLQRIYGPLFIWVVLDGDMIRDSPVVQRKRRKS